ncbi:acid phosphatase precursor [Mytilinidion resinicola]|uniref:Acid phosphatase n=1 Tax=Mytilinidion resinicola TaxID=574789 RepID=A0A6A6YEL5_9PEZI|nr:acid phosphatase precursor [Mytilinidion resinicola]KAF2807008.1 acid phosphatase precursor [Mytilinidion resinicola]
MLFSSSIALAALSLASVANGLSILMSNDDGFGSGNLRELYKILKADGHDVWIVAPATDQSGQGGRSDFSKFANLTAPSEFNLIPAGAPAIGPDPIDNQIWYYNGTPAACVFVALDYVLPRYGSFKTPDLVVSGPNFGTNLGPFLYTLSGTMGATYAAVGRSIPGIAFSGSNPSVPYFNVTNSTNQATWTAAVSARVIKSFIEATPKGQAIFPLGYGANVNIPPLNASYTNPPIFKTRLTGNADIDLAAWNETTKTFHYANLEPQAAGINSCINGDCSLPGETYVVEGGGVSVSIFTVDYDAPLNPYTTMVYNKLDGIVANATTPSRRKFKRSSVYTHP